MAKFKVLRGVHNEGGKTYMPGGVVESKSDLLKHNSPGAPRFAKVANSKVEKVAKNKAEPKAPSENPT